MSSNGTIRKKNGKWLWVGYFKDENGVIHRPSKSFTTKKEAENYLRLQKNENRHIKNIKSKTDYTVNEFYVLWQQLTKWDTEEYYTLTTTTSWRYQFAKNILPYIGNEKLECIDYSKLQDFFSKRTLSEKTYKNIIKDIKSMLDYARYLNDDLIIIDNLSKVKILAEKKPRVKVFNLLSEADFACVYDYMNNNKLHYHNLIMLLHETGLRIEEALALKPCNVDLDGGVLYVVCAIKRQNVTNKIKDHSQKNTKLVESSYLKSSCSYRSVPLTKYAKRAIRSQLAMLEDKKIKSKYLFPTENGNAADARNVLRSFHSSIKQYNKINNANIPRRGLHSLRKLFCKRLRDEINLDWQEMAILMGHSNAEVTKNYYYSVSDEDVAKIAKMLDMADKRLENERYLAAVNDPERDGDDQYVYCEIDDESF